MEDLSVVGKVAAEAVDEEDEARAGDQVADRESHLEGHIGNLAFRRVHLVLGSGEVHAGGGEMADGGEGRC